ncbi:MAG: Gfo/Idh/MocA family oxidoreductase [Verrucomicrobia subdivision 3 bacterium]|nr:Gfo/Idh/MocA family oxidoreductase [Limisphaerales bacterium]
MRRSVTRRSRREFIHQVGVAAITAPVAASLITSAHAQEDKRLGFALVGLGSLSTNQIAPALQKTKHCRLAGIVTGTPAKEQAWADKYNIPRKNIYNYENFDRVADNPDIDVVYVVLPNAMHGEYTIRAARAGKHVLCEKPMEVSVKKCEQMIEACKKANRKLAIGYRCQFVPHHVEAIRLAREKVFGDVKLIEASFGFRIGDPNQWRLKRALAGGGALMDVGIYALQGARYISGEEPVEVFASETKTDTVKFEEVDESILWSMRFPSGVMANCGTSYLVGGMNRLFAAAEKGWFQLDPAYSYSGIQGKTNRGLMEFPQVDHFATEMDDFALCIKNNKPTKVPGEEGLRDVKIMTAIYESIRKGRPVKLG